MAIDDSSSSTTTQQCQIMMDNNLPKHRSVPSEHDIFHWMLFGDALVDHHHQQQQQRRRRENGDTDGHEEEDEVECFNTEFNDSTRSLSECIIPTTSSCNPRRSRRRIRFCDASNNVTHIIPSHTSYSTTAKKQIWSSFDEISQNATRNKREYISEGRNPNCVVEEDEMYYDRTSNELIHPVHLGL